MVNTCLTPRLFLLRDEFSEAQKHLLQGQKIMQEVAAKTDHPNIQYSLQTTVKAIVGQEFAVRLDLINIGKKPAAIVKVENLAPFRINDNEMAALYGP